MKWNQWQDSSSFVVRYHNLIKVVEYSMTLDVKVVDGSLYDVIWHYVVPNVDLSNDMDIFLAYI